MREQIIMYLKIHPRVILKLWLIARHLMKMWSYFVPVQNKTILFNSFGGRAVNDSPKAIYDEICQRSEFRDWKLIWALVNPEQVEIPRGEKIKIDTPAFFKALLYSRVWIGNSGTDRDISLKLKRNLRVETWHGTPLKKICGDEHTETFAIKPDDYKGPIDNETIRCAQSQYDRQLFKRLFHCTEDSILLSDLPRNDEILNISEERIARVKSTLGIPQEKKVILYTPTYREYLLNEDNKTYVAPPINFNKWKSVLGEKYVLLIRAHYAVTASLNLIEDDFVKDVSKYCSVNELYAVADMMISDYSSTYFDYSILNRPMFCFAYDRIEYEKKRGLYVVLDQFLPCRIDYNEESLLDSILNVDIEYASEQTKKFQMKYAPYAGNATKMVVDEIVKRLDINKNNSLK